MRCFQTSRSRPWFRVLATLMLVQFIAALTAPATHALPTIDGHKLLVDNQDLVQRQRLARSGAQLLADYGSFALWRAKLPTLRALDAELPADFDTILLRNGRLDTTTAAGKSRSLPAELRQQATATPQLWLIQLVGPTRDEWLEAIRSAGAEPVGYIPNHAYVVWADGTAVQALEKLAAAGDIIQWTGPYHPAYRLAPALTGPALQQNDNMLTVTIQLYRSPTISQTVQAIEALGATRQSGLEQVLNLINITYSLQAARLAEVASMPEVFNVEPWIAPERFDERQGQIMAGNLSGSQPRGPGYLDWLREQGLPRDPEEYPIVDIFDDGIDNGATRPLHPDFYLGGRDSSRIIYLHNCTTSPNPANAGGHGTINAGIVGGNPAEQGFATMDSDGYRYGLGIAPYARLAGTKIFGDSGWFDTWSCGATYMSMVSASYQRGARIGSNSWGSYSGGAYTASAQAYDALTRDATPGRPGNQEMTHVFAAGNSGEYGAQTIGAPASAKNVIAVGATENVRGDGVMDGCYLNESDSADDLAEFSSRGPTMDGRVKPDLVAPGVHITGPASQFANFNGRTVCGLPDSPYYPAGQRRYTWSSGTSHSTPAVAGAAALLHTYYRTRLSSTGQPPSPAMLKALLLGSTRYLNGDDTAGTLPSTTQGWGGVDLSHSFETRPRLLVDQTVLLTRTGSLFQQNASIADSARPLAVTLAWTDAPGATTGAAMVNNLNLEVRVGSVTYHGNVFVGAHSRPGGQPDTRNNVERVVLPAGLSGPVSIRVSAANLAGDGVPGDRDGTDQDFALVVDNVRTTDEPILHIEGLTVDDRAGGNGNAIAEPGERIELAVHVQNSGDTAATGLAASLDVAGGFAAVQGVGVADSTTLDPGATTAVRFQLNLAATQPCGNPLALALRADYQAGTTAGSLNAPLSLNIGAARPGAVQSWSAADTLPYVLPAGNDGGVTTVTLPVDLTQPIGKPAVRLSLTHPYVNQLAVSLVSPRGTKVALVTNRGGGGENISNLLLDDEAEQSIASASAPFSGVYRPEEPLAILMGEQSGGDWQLVVERRGSYTYPGAVTDFRLEIQPQELICARAAATPALELTLATDGKALRAGQKASLSLHVRNSGGTAIEASALSVTIPRHTRLLPEQSDAWQCAGEGNAGSICRLSLGTLAPGAEAPSRLALQLDSRLPPELRLIAVEAQIAGTVNNAGASNLIAQSAGNVVRVAAHGFERTLLPIVVGGTTKAPAPTPTPTLPPWPYLAP